MDESVQRQLFGSTRIGPGGVVEDFELRLAWWLTTVSMVHALCTSRPRCAHLMDAVNWFTQSDSLTREIQSCLPRSQLEAAEHELQEVAIGLELSDLLPYIVEPHGHVTRKELERSIDAHAVREAKKSDGVYYTPSDVANFMVQSIAQTSGGSWLDPACGTGVFLRAALRHTLREQTSKSQVAAVSMLFGIDRSALALDLASFVLLCDVHSEGQGAPIDLWHTLKANLVCMDAMHLAPIEHSLSLCDAESGSTLRDLFPNLCEHGFDHVVMNPPYASQNLSPEVAARWDVFRSNNRTEKLDLHLAFTEMLWRLTAPQGSAAAVLPLSIGTNTTRGYRNARSTLLNAPGLKEFLFFDREPQALFGEDIKTRSVIAILEKSRPFETRTSSLIKWTAEQRPEIFNRSRTARLEGALCDSFIPKLGSPAEAELYSKLRRESGRHQPAHMYRASLAELMQGGHSRKIVVSSTAYNFINCFFPSALPSNDGAALSSSPLTVLDFSSHEMAYASFALLKSRASYWLWHVECDGFHVSSEFINRCPLWSVLRDDAAVARLANFGRLLWHSTSSAIAKSVNGGRTTYSFHGGHDHPVLSHIEAEISAAFACGDLTTILDKFITRTVMIDGRERTRSFHQLNK